MRVKDDIRYHRILLIRARPGSEASRAAQARVDECREDGRDLMVFFHGNGVEHVAENAAAVRWRRLADWHGASLAVCSGSWARRHEQPPPDPFFLFSLAGFWHHAIDSGRVECFGVGRAE